MKNISCIFISLATIFAFTSCEHKELCLDHTHCRIPVAVVFDWLNAPDADPESMGVYLFPRGGGQPLHYEFTDRNGGTIEIPSGHYDAVCINSDTECAFLCNQESLETFEVSTFGTGLLDGLGMRSELAPRADGSDEERVAMSPELLWSARTDDILLSLPECASSRGEVEQTIVFYPEEVVCHYSVEIRNADNLQYVTALCGSLSGMAGGLLPGSLSLTEERVTLPFSAGSDGTLISGEWLAFGHCPNAADSTGLAVRSAYVSGGSAGFGGSPAAVPAATEEGGISHKLVIYAVLSDGGKWYYTYDVTDQIHAAPDPRHVHIVLDGLPLPEPIGGGGFQPEVGDWQTVHIDIEM